MSKTTTLREETTDPAISWEYAKEKKACESLKTQRNLDKKSFARDQLQQEKKQNE